MKSGMRARPAADTPQARKKQRIGGALLFAGIAANLVATLLAPNQRTLGTVLFGIGCGCVLASIIYMFAARRPA